MLSAWRDVVAGMGIPVADEALCALYAWARFRGFSVDTDVISTRAAWEPLGTCLWACPSPAMVVPLIAAVSGRGCPPSSALWGVIAPFPQALASGFPAQHQLPADVTVVVTPTAPPLPVEVTPALFFPMDAAVRVVMESPHGSCGDKAVSSCAADHGHSIGCCP